MKIFKPSAFFAVMIVAGWATAASAQDAGNAAGPPAHAAPPAHASAAAHAGPTSRAERRELRRAERRELRRERRELRRERRRQARQLRRARRQVASAPLAAPEIDISSGLAAIAAVGAGLLLVRERRRRLS